MKIDIKINPQCHEDKISIEVQKICPKISKLLDYINHIENKTERLMLKKEGNLYPIVATDIYRVVIENKVTTIKTRDDIYQSSLRLYQIKELLTEDFLQISQSELVNINAISHLELTVSGMVKMVMKNDEFTYSSRRFLKTIKEKLKL